MDDGKCWFISLQSRQFEEINKFWRQRFLVQPNSSPCFAAYDLGDEKKIKTNQKKKKHELSAESVKK